MRDFQGALDHLFADLRPSRIILRLETPGAFYPVVAESLAPGIHSVATGPEPDFSQAGTFLFVTGEKRPLVQDDVEAHPLSPPAEIVGHYGVRSQLLVPVVRGDRFVGVVGIHVAEGPRTWTAAEMAQADAFARWVAWELEVEELRERVDVHRATLRLDTAIGDPALPAGTPGSPSDERYFPIVAEALAPGANSLRAAAGPDLRKAATMQRLLRERTTLAQADLLATDTPPPPELIAQYGARAQVLACISEGERLVAFVSAHHAATVREWAPAEIAAVEECAARIAPQLRPRAWGGR